MPTALPRLTITLSTEQYDILTRISELQRRSTASFIREIVDTAMPALCAMVPVLEAREKTVPEQPGALKPPHRGGSGET